MSVFVFILIQGLSKTNISDDAVNYALATLSHEIESSVVHFRLHVQMLCTVMSNDSDLLHESMLINGSFVGRRGYLFISFDSLEEVQLYVFNHSVCKRSK